jgi:heterodisulfide reductase subunit C
MTHIASPLHDADRQTVDKIGALSGQSISTCMQCGTCSAVCPMVDSMGMTTRHGMLLLNFGRAQEVIDACIGEVCASCHACMVRCPRGIDVTKVFESVRQLTLRANTDLIGVRDIPAETMQEAPQIAFVAGFRKLTS